MGLRTVRSLTAVVALGLLTGCTPMAGTPSLTLLAQDDAVDANYVAIGDRIEESDCFHWALILFMWGDMQLSHEAVVQRMLDEYDADVILDAEVTTTQYGIPYIYLQTCSRVEGTPARLADAGGQR